MCGLRVMGTRLREVAVQVTHSSVLLHLANSYIVPKLHFTFHSELAVNVVHRCNGYKVQFVWFALLALSDMGFTFSLTALTINTVAGIADSISWMYIGHLEISSRCKLSPTSVKPFYTSL